MPPPRLSLRWVLKIVLWCLVVGVVLSALGVTAGDFWASLWRVAQDVYHWGVATFGGLWDYILVGAAVVVPVVALRAAWRLIASR